jgi:hypothetical protein
VFRVKPAFPCVRRRNLDLLLLVLLLASSVLQLNTPPKTINAQFTMSRRVNAATDAAKDVTASPRTSRQTYKHDNMDTDADRETAMDKQKRMLEATDPGHFSMIRALHLADLITLLNGTAQSSQLESVHLC